MTRNNFRSGGVLLALAMSVSLTPIAASAQTDLFRSMTNETCSTQARDAVANAARQNVESNVKRAEASIQPPAPIGDLSCLNDLMNINIDFLSGQLFSIGDILGDLISGLSDFTFDSIQGEITRQICDFAAEKWGELTKSLNISPTDLLGDIVPPGFTDNFALINVTQGGASATPSPSSASFGNFNSTNPSIQQTIDEIYNSMGGGN